MECGKIVAPHGVRGEVRVYPYADSPEFLTEFDTLFLGGGHRELAVRSAKVHKGVVILHLEGCETMEDAAALRGQMLYIDRDKVALEQGEHFVQDLIGLRVEDADTGHVYGVISEVSPTGANDVYHIASEGGATRLIPAIKDVVISVDIDSGIMKIRPLAGLFDDED